MAYKKIPLEEQLEKAGKYRIHPEFDACAVQTFGKMLLSDYIRDSRFYSGLGMMLGATPEQMAEMTVRDTALMINRQKRPGQGAFPQRELLLLFAAPMMEPYCAWKEAEDAKKEEA